MENNADILIKEITTKCDELISEAQLIAKQDPVSHLSQSKLQWHGGILGGIQEYKEGKRLEKIMNTELCNGRTFYNYFQYIIRTIDELIDKQVELQTLISEEDEAYYGNVYKIKNSLNTLISAWYNYSPDVASAGITLGDEKDVAMMPTVQYYLKEALKKIHLPSDIVIEPDKSEENSGCFGMLLALIVVPTTLLYFIF